MRAAVAGMLEEIKANWAKKAAACAVIGAACVGLSGCKVFYAAEPPPCPRVSIVADAAKLVAFKDGKQDPSAIEWIGHINHYSGSCLYDRDEKMMNVVLQIGVDAERGPAFVEANRDLRYFISIPAFFPNAKAHSVQSLPLTIAKGAKGVHVDSNEIELNFPISDIKELAKFEIFVGFELDQAQLDYNRAHPKP